LPPILCFLAWTAAAEPRMPRFLQCLGQYFCRYPGSGHSIPCCLLTPGTSTYDTNSTYLRGTIPYTLRNWGVNHTEPVGGFITREGTENVRPRSASKHRILHLTTEPSRILD